MKSLDSVRRRHTDESESLARPRSMPRQQATTGPACPACGQARPPERSARLDEGRSQLVKDDALFQSLLSRRHQRRRSLALRQGLARVA